MKHDLNKIPNTPGVYKFLYIYLFTLVYRCIQYTMFNLAGWQSGYAAACKAVNAGSIPASASMI